MFWSRRLLFWVCKNRVPVGPPIPGSCAYLDSLGKFGFRTKSGLKINVGLGPSSGLLFRSRSGFGLQNEAGLQLCTESLVGRQTVPTMSQVFFSIRYICSQKTLGSNMGIPNLFLARGAIKSQSALDHRSPHGPAFMIGITQISCLVLFCARE